MSKKFHYFRQNFINYLHMVSELYKNYIKIVYGLSALVTYRLIPHCSLSFALHNFKTDPYFVSFHLLASLLLVGGGATTYTVETLKSYLRAHSTMICLNMLSDLSHLCNSLHNGTAKSWSCKFAIRKFVSTLSGLGPWLA